MIKNNILAFIFQMFMILLSTIYLLVITGLNPYLKDLLTNSFIRGILVAFWIGMYIKYGSSMKPRHQRKYDFYSGIIILVVGFILWIYANMDSIPFNIFMNPIYQVSILLDIQFNQFEKIISIFLPTILIGIGTKYKRFKLGMRKIKSV